MDDQSAICKNCSFWIKWETICGETIYGECVKNSPRPIQGQHPEDVRDSATFWPLTQMYHRCGDFVFGRAIPTKSPY
jgi:hypothetical protein